MKIRIIKRVLTVAAVLISGSAIAYTDDKEEIICKKPKYYDFSLPEYKESEKIEVAPESEFEFKISVWSDPETIRLTAKKMKLDYTVESTTTFHRVKSKLPADLIGTFARIDAYVKAELKCHEQVGWLVKIADKKTEGDSTAVSTASESNAPAPTSK